MPPIKELKYLACYMIGICVVCIPFVIYSFFKVGQILYVKNQ